MAVESDMTLLYIVAAYLVVMLGVGVWAYGKTNTAEDFMVAGRSLGAVIIAGTLLATWMGSGTVTGGANSVAYGNGLWPAIILGTGSLLGIGVLKALAPRIRAFNKLTVPEMIEEELGKEGRIISLLVIAFAYVGIVSYQFTGLGYVLNVTTGIPVTQGTLIGTAIIIALAAMGGLMSVAYTDAISAFLMLVGLVVAVPFVLIEAGGWSGVTANVPATHLDALGNLSFFEFFALWAPPLLLILADQNMYQRIIAGETDDGTNTGLIAWFGGAVATMTLVPLIAFASRAMFPELDPGMALIATTTEIPTWIGGILLAAATAFIVTTGSSYLLSACTNLSQDLYRGLINPDASDQQVFWLTRAFVVVLGIFAFVLGQYFPTILEIQMYSYTAYGAAITPPLLAIFLMRERLTKIGGLAGMIAGAVLAVSWDTVLGSPYGLDAVIIAAPVAGVLIVLVSYLTSTLSSPSPTRA
ncbi:sodium:solute symporter family protein [Natrialba asiatica]|uniref:Na /proline symporter n=1 Tax=Natrialba asiatica (strain ATCC 700177 / DSM 12278 / JCM 9576 / FERM P-10747 / NBRC 102637 / 172P1) TaxID=29540 RepID=M0ANG0_NATA1|nr:sodium:solute symporter family protein [Natrialba asiatica]ELZ00035.1 na /proline symporter [Natrialba asiatica DSM 12278]